MSEFFKDTMQGLLEAVEIEKGDIPLTERKDMPGKTYYVSNEDEILIDEIINIRKMENISQKELAEKTGISQQAISRFENKNHSPSLKFLTSIVNAMGYDIQFVKKAGM